MWCCCCRCECCSHVSFVRRASPYVRCVCLLNFGGSMHGQHLCLTGQYRCLAFVLQCNVVCAKFFFLRRCWLVSWPDSPVLQSGLLFLVLIFLFWFFCSCCFCALAFYHISDFGLWTQIRYCCRMRWRPYDTAAVWNDVRTTLLPNEMTSLFVIHTKQKRICTRVI